MTQLRLSLREIRLIVERLVQAAGTPPGLLLSVRDAAVASAVLPIAGFGGLGAEIARLVAVPPRPLRISGDAATTVVDAGGQHAWFVAEAVLDIAIEFFRLHGSASVLVRNLANPSELGVVSALAEKHGLAATVAETGGEIRLTVQQRAADAASLLDRVRRDGVIADPEIWWPLYHASHEALAPDSFESRRHAGTIRVEADGRIVGRNDEDETDLSMLAADPTRLRPASVP